MAWQIELSATAVKQLSKLDKAAAKRITTFLRQRMAPLDDARSTGSALTGPSSAVTGATDSATTESFATSRTAR